MPSFKKNRFFLLINLLPLLAMLYFFWSIMQTTAPAVSGYLLKKYNWNNYGQIVTLYKDKELLASTKTALNGNFSFKEKLTPDNYQLYFFEEQYYLGKQEFQWPLKENQKIIFTYLDQQQKPLYLLELLGFLLAIFLIFYTAETVKKLASREIAWSFALLAATIILFNGTEFIQVILAGRGAEILAANIFTLKHLGLTWFGFAFFYFTLNFPKRSSLLEQAWLRALIAIPLSEALIVISWSFLGSDILFKEIWRFSFAGLRVFIAGQLFFLILLAAGRLFLLNKKEKNPLIKNKLALLLAATFIFFLMLLSFVIIPIIFFNGHAFFAGQYPAAASLAGLLLLIMINLTVTKYRFSAKENVLDQTLLSSFFNFFTVITLAAGLVFFEHALLKNNNYLLKAYSLFFLVLTAFLFKEKLQKKLNDIFLGDHFKQREILTKNLQKTIGILNKKELVTFLKKEIQEYLGHKKINIVLLGKKQPGLKKAYLSLLDQEFAKIPGVDQETEIVIPLQNQSLFGYIILGGRTGGLPYKESELELLAALAAQAALAINSAHLTETLLRQQREIEQSARLASLGTLAAGFAHEIKNPLTVLCNLMALYPEQHRDKEFLKTFQEMMPRQLTRINQLVQNILNFARPADTKRGALYLEEVLERTAVFLKIPAGKKSISIETVINSRPTIKGSAKELEQVLLNLGLNAIEAMPGGGKIIFSLETQEQTAVLKVSDTGKGIDKKDLPRIFEPFFTKKANGTGLGLSIVYNIIERHHGKITVSSQKNRGTVFTICLPLK